MLAKLPLMALEVAVAREVQLEEVLYFTVAPLRVNYSIGRDSWNFC